MDAPQPPIVCLVGSTGTGKSDIAVEAIRATAPGEVISCDAYAVYRDMPILTAAPSAPSDVPHHLVGVLPTYDTYDAARFLTDADFYIQEARSRDRTPWIVGGSAMYLRCWLKGIGPTAPSDPIYRDELTALVTEQGPQALHDLLRAADPTRADALHPNDVRRVGRALEIIKTSGRPASEQRLDWTGPDRVPATIVGLRRSWDDLDERIGRRTTAMFEAGIVDEVTALRTQELSPQASRVLGLAEVSQCLDGALTQSQAYELIAQRTRRYARKQMTFFRSFDAIQWIDLTRDDTATSAAQRVVAALSHPKAPSDLTGKPREA